MLQLVALLVLLFLKPELNLVLLLVEYYIAVIFRQLVGKLVDGGLMEQVLPLMILEEKMVFICTLARENREKSLGRQKYKTGF
jgi:hypothetical protein